MNDLSPKLEDKPNDDYLKIWEVEQKHTNTRWTVTTFFLSVSFAIFGASLQSEKPYVLIVSQLVAIAIYWFTYSLFLRFNDFTVYLRQRLKEMEASGKTTLDIQTKSDIFMREQKRPSAKQLLLYFGIGYTIAGLVIGLFFRP